MTQKQRRYNEIITQMLSQFEILNGLIDNNHIGEELYLDMSLLSRKIVEMQLNALFNTNYFTSDDFYDTYMGVQELKPIRKDYLSISTSIREKNATK